MGTNCLHTPDAILFRSPEAEAAEMAALALEEKDASLEELLVLESKLVKTLTPKYVGTCAAPTCTCAAHTVLYQFLVFSLWCIMCRFSCTI